MDEVGERGDLVGPGAQLGELHLGGGDVAGERLQRGGAAAGALELGDGLLAPPGDRGAPLLERVDVGPRTEVGELGLGQRRAQHGQLAVVRRRCSPVEGGEPARRQQGRGGGQHVVEAGVGGPLPPPSAARCRPRPGRAARRSRPSTSGLAALRGVGQPGDPGGAGPRRRRVPSASRSVSSARRGRERVPLRRARAELLAVGGQRARRPPRARRAAPRERRLGRRERRRPARRPPAPSRAQSRPATRPARRPDASPARARRRGQLALLALDGRRPPRPAPCLGRVGDLAGGLLVGGGDDRPGRARPGAGARSRRRPGSRRRRPARRRVRRPCRPAAGRAGRASARGRRSMPPARACTVRAGAAERASSAVGGAGGVQRRLAPSRPTPAARAAATAASCASATRRSCSASRAGQESAARGRGRARVLEGGGRRGRRRGDLARQRRGAVDLGQQGAWRPRPGRAAPGPAMAVALAPAGDRRPRTRGRASSASAACSAASAARPAASRTSRSGSARRPASRSPRSGDQVRLPGGEAPRARGRRAVAAGVPLGRARGRAASSASTVRPSTAAALGPGRRPDASRVGGRRPDGGDPRRHAPAGPAADELRGQRLGDVDVGDLGHPGQQRAQPRLRTATRSRAAARSVGEPVLGRGEAADVEERAQQLGRGARARPAGTGRSRPAGSSTTWQNWCTSRPRRVRRCSEPSSMRVLTGSQPPSVQPLHGELGLLGGPALAALLGALLLGTADDPQPLPAEGQLAGDLGAGRRRRRGRCAAASPRRGRPGTVP